MKNKKIIESKSESQIYNKKKYLSGKTDIKDTLNSYKTGFMISYRRKCVFELYEKEKK